MVSLWLFLWRILKRIGCENVRRRVIKNFPWYILGNLLQTKRHYDKMTFSTNQNVFLKTEIILRVKTWTIFDPNERIIVAMTHFYESLYWLRRALTKLRQKRKKYRKQLCGFRFFGGSFMAFTHITYSEIRK